jgi:molecular chaperone GrpE (heat shock protein)
MMPGNNWKNISIPEGMLTRPDKPKAEAGAREIEITEEAYIMPDVVQPATGAIFKETVERLAELEYESRRKEYNLRVLEEKAMKNRKRACLGLIELLDLLQDVLASFRVKESFSAEEASHSEQKGRGTHPITGEGLKNLRIVEKRIRELLADAGVQEIKAQVGAALNVEEHEILRTVHRKKMKDGVVAGVVKSGYKLEQTILRKPLVEVVRNH